MKFLLVLCAVVCCSYGDRHPREPEHKGDRMGPGMNEMGNDWGKEPCCLPDQYHAKMGTHNGYRDADGNFGQSKEWAEYNIDFAAGRMHGHETVWTDGKVVNMTYVADFRKKYAKVLFHDTKKCIWFELPGPLVGQCISKTAQFKGSNRIGMGEGSIGTDNWNVKYDGDDVKMHMDIGVTAEHCVPVYSKIAGRVANGLEFRSSTLYFDTMDRVDERVFDTPDECMDATKVDIPDAAKVAIFFQEKFFPTTTPHKCCFPMQWEGKMSQITGANINGQGSTVSVHMPKVAVNYEYMKFVVHEYIAVNGVSTKNMSFIGDLRYGVMYEIDINTKECKKFNIPSVTNTGVQCIPASARAIGQPTLGLKDGGVPTTVWRMTYSSGQVNMSVDMTVTQKHGYCVPLSELAMGENADGTSFMTATGFYDLKGGIDDPSVFHPPETCDGAAVEDLPPDVSALIDGMLKRFAT